MKSTRLGGRLLSIAVALVLVYVFREGHVSPPTPSSHEVQVGNAEQAVAAAIAAKQSDIAISGAGEVIKLLPDDQRGSRHQRFLLRLSSGATLLVAHNMARRRNLWVNRKLFRLVSSLKEAIELSAGGVEFTLCGLGDEWPD